MNLFKLLKLSLSACISVFLLFQLISHSSFAAQLEVLTFNTWLFPGYFFVSKDMDERIALMPRVLAGSDAGIIALQEVWTPSFRAKLTEEMKALGYLYSAAKDQGLGINFIRGWFGNGLLIFSKYPILGEADLLSFSEYTRLDEYPTRKGAIHVVVQVPSLGNIDVYNTHFGVVSVDEQTGLYDPEGLKLMHTQSGELIEFIRKTTQTQRTLLFGDLNIHPVIWDAKNQSYFKDFGSLQSKETTHLSSIYFELIHAPIHGSNLKDAFHSVKDLFDPIYTFDVKNNTYLKKGKYASTNSEYLDYTFYSDRENRLRPAQVQLFAKEPVFDFPKGKNLSDHSGVLTTFEY